MLKSAKILIVVFSLGILFVVSCSKEAPLTPCDKNGIDNTIDTAEFRSGGELDQNQNVSSAREEEGGSEKPDTKGTITDPDEDDDESSASLNGG